MRDCRVQPPPELALQRRSLLTRQCSSSTSASHRLDVDDQAQDGVTPTSIVSRHPKVPQRSLREVPLVDCAVVMICAVVMVWTVVAVLAVTELSAVVAVCAGAAIVCVVA